MTGRKKEETDAMQIIKDILRGNHNPVELSKHRDSRMQASGEEVIKSLQEVWKDKYLFTL